MEIGYTAKKSSNSIERGFLGHSSRTRTIVVAVIGVLIVLVVGYLIRKSHFDFPVVHFLNQYHHGKLGSITSAVYKVFGPTAAIVGTVVLTGLVLLITKNLRSTSTFAATIAGTWLSLAVVKLVVHRVRPDSALLQFPYHPILHDASYPSGHTAFVAALVAVVVMGLAVTWQRWVAGILGGLLILFVATSLMIDGVHYPSDVTASIIWSLTLAPLVRHIWVFGILPLFDKKK